MKRHSLMIALAILLLGTGLLTACQSQGETVSVTRLVESEVTKEVEVTRIVTQEVEATRIVEVTPTPTPIPTGGFLVTTMSDDVVFLNPLLAYDTASEFVNGFLYGRLFETDPFSGELVCHFCQQWQAADRTFTFTLRNDVTWSDGQPVTADDLVYTFAALMWAAANESLDSPHLDVTEKVESIAKVDESTVTITLKEANCLALEDLNLRWIPQHLYGPEWTYTGPISLQGPFGDADDPDFSAIAGSEMNQAPIISNGPFRFDQWVPGDHITLVRNTAYFRGAPYLDGLVVRIVPDQADQVQMLRTGEIDVVEDFPARYLTEVELLGKLNVFKVLDDSYVYVGFQLGSPADPQPRWLEDENSGAAVLNAAHGEHSILGDLRVRQAISYGLDRTAIVSQVAVGQGLPMSANLLPSLGWAYNGELAPYDYDPEKAAALLDEAGWVLGDNGLRQRDGRSLSLSLKTNISNDSRVQIGELVAEQLGRLGFDVEFEAMEWGSFVGTLLGQQFDLVVISWTNLGSTPDDSLFFASENDVPGRGFNFVSYYSPEMDQAWRDAVTVPGCDLNQRAAIYRQIQARLHDDLPYAWLYAPLTLIGANQRLIGIDPGPWGTWHNVETWYLAN